MTRTHGDRHERALSLFDQFLRGARGKLVQRESIVPPATEPPASSEVTAPAVEPQPVIDATPTPVATKPALDANEIETFLQEMKVLLKYGHSGQVAELVDRFALANVNEVMAVFRVAEFEFSVVSPNDGLERLFRLASRALDQGDMVLARRIHERVKRDAPGDLRVMALGNRVRS